MSSELDDLTNLNPPASIVALERATREVAFSMPSSRRTGSLLRMLAASKPGGRVLELATGTGLATAWMLDGLDDAGQLDSLDSDPQLLEVARQYLGDDPRLTLHAMDGDEFIPALISQRRRFDLIFADTWPGKLRWWTKRLAWSVEVGSM